jgi:hypothetical protein
MHPDTLNADRLGGNPNDPQQVAWVDRAAEGSGINYRTARRIVEGAAEHRQRQLVAVG